MAPLPGDHDNSRHSGKTGHDQQRHRIRPPVTGVPPVAFWQRRGMIAAHYLPRTADQV
jgi:hypothetical protein